jgi:peptidoglycan-N-acetylglucosamine deacetylase
MSERGDFHSRFILSFDCDFPRDVESLQPLVNLLEEFDIQASFACIGQWVRTFPDEHRRLVDAGHEIINHTQTHPNLYHADYDYAQQEGLSREFFNRLGSAGRRREIERGHADISEVLGVEPIGFRTPHFGALHVDDIYGILAELGYRFSSSTMAAHTGPLPYQTSDGIWEIPLSPCPLHPFGVFDSWHSIGKCKATHSGRGELTALFADLLGTTFSGEEGGLVNIYLDPWDAVHSGELRTMLELVQERSIATICYGDLCDELERVAAFRPPEVEALQEFVK